jgi:BASS family bile acid:Na+ symporter
MHIKDTADRINSFIHHYLIWLIIASYGLASIVPEPGMILRGIQLSNPFSLNHYIPLSLILLSLLLFNAGIGVKISELREIGKDIWLLCVGVIANVIVPLIFISIVSLVSRYWHNPREAQEALVGMALVASMPIAGASTAWSQNANGKLSLSLGLVLATTILSPILTPSVLHYVGFITEGDYSEDLHELAAQGVQGFLQTWVILPAIVGIIVRQLLGERWFTQICGYLKLINYCVLIVLNYSNASLALPGLIKNPDLDFLVMCLTIVTLLCILGFWAGNIISQLFNTTITEKASLMFGLGMNNNGTGLVLASISLSDHPEVMIPIILYNLMQHLIASIVNSLFFESDSE